MGLRAQMDDAAGASRSFWRSPLGRKHAAILLTRFETFRNEFNFRTSFDRVV
jgi:hypothetical protein